MHQCVIKIIEYILSIEIIHYITNSSDVTSEKLWYAKHFSQNNIFKNIPKHAIIKIFSWQIIFLILLQITAWFNYILYYIWPSNVTRHTELRFIVFSANFLKVSKSMSINLPDEPFISADRHVHVPSMCYLDATIRVLSSTSNKRPPIKGRGTLRPYIP